MSNGNRFVGQVQFEAGFGQVFQFLEARRVILGEDDHQAIGDKGFGVILGDPLGGYSGVHIFFAGAGKNICFRALIELLGQLLRTSEIESNRYAGVLGFEGFSQFGERFGQGGSRQNRQGARLGCRSGWNRSRWNGSWWNSGGRNGGGGGRHRGRCRRGCGSNLRCAGAGQQNDQQQ